MRRLFSLVLVGSIAFAHAPAQATFPGTNGDIFYVATDASQNASAISRTTLSGTTNNVKNCSSRFSAISVAQGGGKLAYACSDGSDDEIYVQDLTNPSAAPTQITNNSVSDLDPAFSPNGDAIAYASGPTAGRSQICVWYESSNTSECISSGTAGQFGDWAPNWRPGSGTFSGILAFVSDRDGDADIYTISVADGEPASLVTNNTSIDFAPNWPPDASAIFFSNNSSGTDQIWLAYPGPNDIWNTRAFFSSPTGSYDTEPALSPDGSKIAFTRQGISANDPMNLMVVDRDGTGLTQVTGAAWQADWESLGGGGDPVYIARTVSLALKKHLKAVGRVTLAESEAGCIDRIPVIIQKKKGGKFVKVKSTTATADSALVATYKTALPDAPGTYRAKIKERPLGPADNPDVICGAAVSPTRKHTH